MDAQNRRDRIESFADEPDLLFEAPAPAGLPGETADPEQEDLLLALDRARLERRRAQSEAPSPPEP